MGDRGIYYVVGDTNLNSGNGIEVADLEEMKAHLKRAIRTFIDAHNTAPKPFVWTKNADQILASIARFAQRTTDDHPADVMARTTGTGQCPKSS